MPGISTDLKKALAQWIFKQTAFITPPTTLFYSLHSADPGDVGTNELDVLSPGYARAELDPDPDTATNINYTNTNNIGDTLLINNASVITFPKSASLWNNGNPIPFWALWSQSTGGLFIMAGTISGDPVVVGTSGVILSVPVEHLIITIS